MPHGSTPDSLGADAGLGIDDSACDHRVVHVLGAALGGGPHDVALEVHMFGIHAVVQPEIHEPDGPIGGKQDVARVGSPQKSLSWNSDPM